MLQESYLVHLNIRKIAWQPLRPGPRWGAYSAAQDPLVGEEGAGCPSPKTPPPISALHYNLHNVTVTAALEKN